MMLLSVPRKGNTMKKPMSNAKHEKSEGPKARLKEYGSKTGGVKSTYPPKKKK
jgi:hypothetical protein